MLMSAENNEKFFNYVNLPDLTLRDAGTVIEQNGVAYVLYTVVVEIDLTATTGYLGYRLSCREPSLEVMLPFLTTVARVTPSYPVD